MKTREKIRQICLNSKTWLLILLCISHLHSFAQEKDVVEPTSTIFSNPVFIGLLVTILMLLFAILIFANVAKTAIIYKREKDRKIKKDNSSLIKTIILVFIPIFGAFSTYAQDTQVAEVLQETITKPASKYWGLDSLTFFSMIGIIVFELFVVWFLYGLSMEMLGARELKEKRALLKAKTAIKKVSFIEKMNASVSLEKEGEIMLDHNYDGIRELDNNLPPWWKYGFYATIIFSIIYMFHFHVFHTGKLQAAEYKDQLDEGERQLAEYRKKAANLVDETNAELLTDGTSISSGKSIYQTNCVACHGNAGEGGVGPNLTDDYWLHGGDIKDVFKTIKYGWPELGMKAWQQDLGAKQIHEVSSYIMSLKGTNPPNAKEKQGELFKEK